ncbi:response regulator [Pedobacter nototheniae]|uniref:response regulator n=1 Tax=Pedobacter nototheniae TaxID=2488994 RepID=UPI002931CB7A|nr:response regulator [Pedobacter nototheniae]
MKKILIIDNDRSTLEVLELIFKEDYEVKTVEHSISFFKVVKTFKPDLVIVDYLLSEANTGYDICEKLGSNINTKHIPIIIFSVMNNLVLPHHLKHCYFIPKPFDLDHLTTQVAKLI